MTENREDLAEKASEFLLGYNRGAQVWIPGNEGPTKFCIEI